MLILCHLIASANFTHAHVETALIDRQWGLGTSMGASDTSWTWNTAQNSYAGKYIIRLYEVYVVEYVMTDFWETNQ